MKKIIIILLCLISGYVNGQTFLTHGRIDTIWSSGQVPRGLNNTNTWYTLFKKNPTVNYLPFKDTLQAWQNSWWSQDATYLYMHSPTAWSAKDTLLERALFRNILTGKIVERGIPYLSRDSLVFVKGGGVNSIKRNDGVSLSDGANSTASGPSSIASGIASIASGGVSLASGDYSVASGYSSIASGAQSVASGHNSEASGTYSTASGSASTASGAYTNVLGTGITEATDSTTSVNKLKIYSTPTWADATDTTNKVLLWDATTKSVIRGVMSSGASTNPTSTYIPYNNAGTYADSWLSKIGDTVKIANGKYFTSENGRSYLDFNYGNNAILSYYDGVTNSYLNFGNAAQIIYSDTTISSAVSLEHTVLDFSHSTKINFNSPIINITQAPAWANTDTTISKALFRNASTGNLEWRGVTNVSDAINTTDTYIPRDSSGILVNSILHQVGTRIKIADNKLITSENELAYLHFKSGSDAHLEYKNWDGSVIGGFAVDSTQANMRHAYNKVLVDSTMVQLLCTGNISLDAPVVKINQLPSWGNTNDTVNFRILGRNASGSVVQGSIKLDTATSALINTPTGTGRVVTNYGLNQSSYSSWSKEFVFDGQGSVISTGSYTSKNIDRNVIITGWKIVETSATPVSSTIDISLYRDSYSNYPPTIADTINYYNRPLLSAATKNTATYTTPIVCTKGDYILPYINNNTGAIRIELVLIGIIKN